MTRQISFRGLIDTPARWFRVRHLLALTASVPVSLVGGWFLYRVLVPDICHYHRGKYLDSEELPAWIQLFFPPVDSMQHPEPNALYCIVCVIAGLTLTSYGIHRADKRKQRKEIEHFNALDSEKAPQGE